MKVQHDEVTGRVRCDDASLDDLLRDPTAGPGSLLADERSRAALGAIATALTEGRVIVSGSSCVLDHRFWIAPGAAAFFLALRDGRGDLVGLAPALVPGRLAALVGLGPRRGSGDVRERSPQPIAVDLLEDALHPCDLRRQSALAVLGARRGWRLDAQSSGADPGAARSMTVLDRPDGYWFVSGVDAPSLIPTTATVLWRRLTTVLA